MILVDTSVWITHLRSSNEELTALLNEQMVAIHPFIIGELACGKIEERQVILNLLNRLPKSVSANHEEVLSFIENNKLMGSGVGWVDFHLLASSVLSGTPLWTADKSLRTIAALLGVLY